VIGEYDEPGDGGGSGSGSGSGEGGRGLLPDGIKKALVSGLSALFMTEEGIRSAIGDMRLPKEAVAFLLQQTEKSRKEIFRAVSEELKSFLTTMDLASAVRKALVGMKLEINAQVRFVEDGTTETKVTSRVAGAPATDEPTDDPTSPRKRRSRR
jgi:hypothetical protein